MKVDVYGCGFAGLVSILGLWKNGVQVRGIDTNRERVGQLQKGQLFTDDKGLHQELGLALNQGLEFSSHVMDVSQINFIAVPTSLNQSGELDIDQVSQCLKQLIVNNSERRTLLIIIRSTLPIKGLKKIKARCQKYQNYTSSTKIIYIPEFMREGTGLEDWKSPPLSIVGSAEELSADEKEIICRLFQRNDFQFISDHEAEVIKLACNSFHAMKITFANEVMRICQDNNVSEDVVMNSFCQDNKLNVSSLYLSPGLPWGGPCLKKDLKSLIAQPSRLPLLESLISSNQEHLQFYKKKILGTGASKIIFVGAGFKNGVNDSRESPIIELVAELCKEHQITQIQIYTDNPKALKTDILIHSKVRIQSCVEDLELADLIVYRAKTRLQVQSLKQGVAQMMELR